MFGKRLPKGSDALVQAVLAANPNAIIVNQSGMPVEFPWLKKATTLLQVREQLLPLECALLSTNTNCRHSTAATNGTKHRVLRSEPRSARTE